MKRLNIHQAINCRTWYGIAEKYGLYFTISIQRKTERGEDKYFALGSRPNFDFQK